MERKLFSMLIAGFVATGITGAAYGVANDPLPIMPKSEYPGTGNEPAGITGIAADAPDVMRSKSEYDTGKAENVPMSRTEDTERDFGEESS